MTIPLKPSAARVQETLRAGGYANEVIELTQTARSAAEAAAAIGCTVAQIVKSLVFKGADTGSPVLVLASGTNRVNERALAALIGEAVVRPDAEYVREQTGFAIGGIPPLGHRAPLATFIDEDLLQYETIWAAAGHPHAVFRLTPAELVSMTGGVVARIV